MPRLIVDRCDASIVLVFGKGGFEPPQPSQKPACRFWLKFTTIRNAAECQLNQCFVLWCRLVPSCPCHMDGTWKSAVCSPRVPCGLECALDSGQFLTPRDAGCERHSVRTGRMGCTDQAHELGSSRAQAVARSGQEAAASQRPRHHARQQARSHCLERPCSWSNFRGEQDSGRVIKASRRNSLPAEVGERNEKRDGGSVFPAHANTGDPR
jgi:hypothetical protein